MLRGALVACLLGATVSRALAIDLDVTLEDVDRALAVARAPERERAVFHARYIQHVDVPLVERVEVVSEYRRVVLIAESRIREGDRSFGFSVSRAAEAAKVWKKRVAVLARLRFHPQNNYVDVPEIDIRMSGHEEARIGVLKQRIDAPSSGIAGERVPVVGAIAEGVFDAEAVGQGRRELVIAVDGREAARVTFDLAVID